jgi:hypothetical protein
VVSTPANGAVYPLKQSVNAAYTCTDGGAGGGSCIGTVPTGSPIDTSSSGAKTFVVNATDAVGNATNATVSYTVKRMLTAVGPAKIWIGLKNNGDAGLRVDLQAVVLVDGVVAATGTVNNVATGGNGFDDAILHSIAMSLASPVNVPAGAQLSLRVGARRTCTGTGPSGGIVREWFNGLPLDGALLRDAGSRVHFTLGGSTADLYLRSASQLSLLPGILRQSSDVTVNSLAACPVRPYVPFGTWSAIVP